MQAGKTTDGGKWQSPALRGLSIDWLVILVILVVWVTVGVMAVRGGQSGVGVDAGAETRAHAGRVILDGGGLFFRESGLAQSTQADSAAFAWRDARRGEVFNFGFTGDTVWVKVPVSLPPPSARRWNLVIPYPLLEKVDVYVLDERGEVRYRTSLVETRASRQMDNQNLVFALPKDVYGNLTLMARISSTTAMHIPLEIWSDDYLAQRQVAEIMLWGLYFGVLLALIAYNVILFFSIRDFAYFYYGLYLICSVGVMLCLSGMGPVYIWTGETTFNRHALTFFTGMTSLWMLAFTRTFLRGERFPKGLSKVLIGGAVVCVLLIVHAWFNPVLGARLSATMAGFTITLALAAGFFALYKGVVIARFFVLAFAMFAGGTSLYLFSVLGWIPVSGISTHAIQVGSALEAVLLSLALAHRIKEERMAALVALQEKHLADQQVRQIEQKALEAAMHDPLTQMPNESLLLKKLHSLFAADSGFSSLGVVILQFPALREISTSLGRAMADPLFCRLLHSLNWKLSSSELTLCLEPHANKSVAVTEFGCVAFLVRHHGDASPVVELARSICDDYDRSFEVGEISVNLDAFCGIAFWPDHASRPEMLLQHAYASLEQGRRNCVHVCVFSPDIDAYGHRRLAVMGALSQAIKENELEVYIQAQMNCGDHKLAGGEILLRWNSHRYGMVPTQEFIEMAENAGMMKHITRYVVSRGMLFLKQMHQRGLPMTVSVNLSIQNLIETDFVEYVVESAQALGIDMRYLVLEVTETSASEDLDTVIHNLQRLAQAGCSIALDDFGTGYASLAYLSRLPIHELKIDRSFIAAMNRSDSDLRIVENTVTLARTLHIQTVAEGVEDDIMLATITALGCDRAQGYLVSKPMPVSSFPDWAMRKFG